MLTEIVYIGRSNKIDLVLLADDSVPSLAGVTRMTLTLNDGTVIDSKVDAGVFDWTKTITVAEAAKVPGAKAGDSKLVLSLGEVIAASGEYDAELTVYDDENTLGITWGRIRLVAQ